MIKSIKEVLSFSDLNLGNIDVAHFVYNDDACRKIREIGIKLEFPEVQELKNSTREIKNKTTLRPPKLR